MQRGAEHARRQEEPLRLLADACNRGPSTFTRNTRRLETLKLQLRGAAGEEAANLKKALKRCRDAAYEDIKRDGYVREEDWHACVDAFKEREKRTLENAGKFCGACGIRDAEDWGGREQDLAKLSPGHWLGLSDEQREAYDVRRAEKFELIDERGTPYIVSAADFDNVCEVSGRLLYVDRDCVKDAKIHVCSHCRKALRTHKAPRDCFATDDYGRLRVEGKGRHKGVGYKMFSRKDLELNVIERLTVARARAYTLIVKVVSVYVTRRSAQRLRTRVNTIAFLHDSQGPSEEEKATDDWDARYGERALVMALDSVQPLFVGPSGQRGRLETLMLRLPYMKLRPERLFNHLQIRKHVPPTPDPLDARAPSYEWFKDRCNRMNERLAAVLKEKASLSTETLLESTQRASDIAGVREHARDDPESETGVAVETQDDGFGDVERPDGDVERPDGDEYISASHRGLLPEGTTTFAGLVSKVAEECVDMLEGDEKSGRGPASGRCQQLFYCPSLTSPLVLMRPVNKPHSNILDPQGPVPRKGGASGM